MSASQREEINFWPGYVDALINVLLNLLFLVGIFTVGLVALNAEALLVQKKAAQLRIAEHLEGARGQERVVKAQALLQTLSEPAKPTPIPERVESMPPRAYEVQEIRIQRAQVPARLDGPERSDIVSSIARSTQAVDSAVIDIPGGQVVGQFSFDLNDYTLSSTTEQAWQKRSLSGDLTLVVVADANNPRVSREAFARLVAVRDFLIRDGHLASQIQLRMQPPKSAQAHAAHFERTVFVVQK